MSALDELLDEKTGGVEHDEECVLRIGINRIGLECDCGRDALEVGPARAELAALRAEIASLKAKVERADDLAAAIEMFGDYDMDIGVVGKCAAYRSAP